MELTEDMVLLKLKQNLFITKEKIDELSNLNPAKENFERECYRLTSELCTWITVTFEFWMGRDAIFKERIKGNETLLGIKQAFNSFKHNFDITGVSHNEEISFNSEENNCYIKRLVWLSSELLEDDKNNKRAFEAYQNNFKDKAVVIKLEAAFQILMAELMYKSIRENP